MTADTAPATAPSHALEHQLANLRSTLGKLEIALSSIQEAIAWTDERGFVQWCNKAFVELLRRPYLEILNFRLVELMPSLQFEPTSVGESVLRIVDTGTRESKNRVIEIGVGAGTRTLDLTSTPVNSNRPEDGTVWVFHDVTGHVQLHRELEQARDDAMQSSRLKSEFLANVSHEIRTPMTGILGLSSLLAESVEEESQREYAVSIRDCGEILLGLINDILDFSKIEAGKLSLIRTAFDPRVTVEDVLKMFHPIESKKAIELTLQFQSDIPETLYGDPGRLRQVLTNLVGNAVKFTEKGAIGVRVRPLQVAEDYLTLKFEIHDTGSGISHADYGKLFLAFSQIDSSSTREYGGTGLGLVISKRLVDLMKGQIGVESQPGVGSTFWFTARFELGEEPGG